MDRLAQHALRGEAWGKAVRYLHQAGVKAALRSAYREAMEFFEQALTALAHLPESAETLREAIDIRIALGPALLAIKGIPAPEVEASYSRAQELCTRLGDTSRLFPVLWGLWYVNYGRGEHRTARELGERLLTVAEASPNAALLLEAHHSLWATLMGMADFASATVHLQKGMALYDPQQHRSLAFVYGAHDPGVCCRSFSALALWERGYPDQAVKMMQESMGLAVELSHPYTTTIALYTAAWIHYQRGEHQTAREKAEALVALATAQGFSIWKESGAMIVARLMIEKGRDGELMARLEHALIAVRTYGVIWRQIFSLCLLAEAYGRVGQPERGLELLSQAIAERSLEGLYEPELHRVKGELLLKQATGGAGDAEACFRRAIEVALAHQEKSLELRAVTSLSRLLHRQGNREEARRLLAETYAWFTEGSETADLKAAKAVLDELGG